MNPKIEGVGNVRKLNRREFMGKALALGTCVNTACSVAEKGSKGDFVVAEKKTEKKTEKNTDGPGIIKETRLLSNFSGPIVKSIEYGIYPYVLDLAATKGYVCMTERQASDMIKMKNATDPYGDNDNRIKIPSLFMEVLDRGGRVFFFGETDPHGGFVFLGRQDPHPNPGHSRTKYFLGSTLGSWNPNDGVAVETK